MIHDLKPYPKMKHSGVEWLGDVPKHWDILPGRACIYEKHEPNVGMVESTVLSLSYGRIVIKPKEKLRGLVPASFETYQVVNPGDVICRPTDLQNDRTSLRFGIAKDRGIITSAYMCFGMRSRYDGRYGHLLLHTYDLKKVFYGMGSGLRQNLSWEDFKYLPCLVPSIPEQVAIVQYLDYVDRRVGRLVRAKQKLIKLLEEQRQAIIHRAVTRGLDTDMRLRPSGVEWLGDVPDHWEVKRLKWVTRLQRGYDLPAERRTSGPFPVVSSGGIIDTHSDARSKGPGVVMGRYGSTDAVFFIETDFWPHNTALFVTDFRGNSPRWCYFMLRTISKADHSGKSAVPGVDRKDLYEIKVSTPPRGEQDEIVDQIEKALAQVEQAIGDAQREIALLREYRTRMIADVVTGKLDVREVEASLWDEEEGQPGVLDEVESQEDTGESDDIPEEVEA